MVSSQLKSSICRRLCNSSLPALAANRTEEQRKSWRPNRKAEIAHFISLKTFIDLLSPYLCMEITYHKKYFHNVKIFFSWLVQVELFSCRRQFETVAHCSPAMIIFCSATCPVWSEHKRCQSCDPLLVSPRTCWSVIPGFEFGCDSRSTDK